MECISELRQCDLLNKNAVNHIFAIAPTHSCCSANDICAILTQDCDIVHSPTQEPYLEIISAFYISGADGNVLNGENPRILHLTESDTVLCFSIHDRFL